MKKAQPFVGLNVMGIEMGEQLGKVAGFVINPDSGRVDYLLLERDIWYGEMRALNYDAVLGVGEFAVTTNNSKEIYSVSQKPEIISLLEKDIQLVKAGVITRSGEYVGVITEYYIDEKTGKIAGCEICGEKGEMLGIIPADKVITFGSKYIVIDDNREEFLLQELSGTPQTAVPADADGKDASGSAVLEEESGGVSIPEPAVESVEKPAEEAVEEEKAAEEQKAAEAKVAEDPLELFEARQRQYLLGKKAAKKIIGAGGKVIVDEGEIITNEIIELAVADDKYIELTMNVK
ncbi:hypothetical protein DCCM_4513 [Desulfocucumis palustris]|uniref:PRC-barrel domain-containing protein n=1 Tax=Desulfocucumis palustris TaxID=1898651 RepID=A0A2L2XGY3_9FIRM|nr:PRC-barrel domain-containing protein [Desulfocucumis palustris]GBF35390.1 hypothetical protein DCCM_4513 [Desulfocucumis palustris]